MLSWKNSWMHKALRRNPETLHTTPVCCQILDVVDASSGKFYIGDGLFFILATIRSLQPIAGTVPVQGHAIAWPNNSAELVVEMARLKGLIMVINRYKFVMNDTLQFELQVNYSECLSPGSIMNDMMSLNKAIIQNRIAARTDCFTSIETRHAKSTCCPMDLEDAMSSKNTMVCHHLSRPTHKHLRQNHDAFTDKKDIALIMQSVAKGVNPEMFSPGQLYREKQVRLFQNGMGRKITDAYLSTKQNISVLSKMIAEDIGPVQKRAKHQKSEDSDVPVTKCEVSGKEPAQHDIHTESKPNQYRIYIPSEGDPKDPQEIPPERKVGHFDIFLKKIQRKIMGLIRHTLPDDLEQGNIIHTMTQKSKRCHKIQQKTLSKRFREIAVETEVTTPKKEAKTWQEDLQEGEERDNPVQYTCRKQKPNRFYVFEDLYMIKASKFSTCRVILKGRSQRDNSWYDSWPDNSTVSSSTQLTLKFHQQDDSEEAERITERFLDCNSESINFCKQFHKIFYPAYRISFKRCNNYNSGLLKDHLSGQMRFIRPSYSKNRRHPISRRIQKPILPKARYIDYTFGMPVLAKPKKIIDY